MFDHEAALVWLDGLELAEAPAGLSDSRGGDDSIPTFGTAPQAIAAGSQLIEFDASVDPQTRAMISNALLLAQLAADKTAPAGPPDVWYARYREILVNLGWITTGLAHTQQSFAGQNLQVQAAVLSVLTAALQPAAAAASILQAALASLDKLAPTTPWLTIFNRASRHSSFNSFQLAYGVVQAAQPQLTLIGFTLEGAEDLTQVMFVKFAASDARLDLYSGQVTPNLAAMTATAPKVAAMIADKASAFLATVEI